MNKIRYYIAVWLFDLAAKVYPIGTKWTAQAHHVGNRWLEWKVSREN